MALNLFQKLFNRHMKNSGQEARLANKLKKDLDDLFKGEGDIGTIKCAEKACSLAVKFMDAIAASRGNNWDRKAESGLPVLRESILGVATLQGKVKTLADAKQIGWGSIWDSGIRSLFSKLYKALEENRFGISGEEWECWGKFEEDLGCALECDKPVLRVECAVGYTLEFIDIIVGRCFSSAASLVELRYQLLDAKNLKGQIDILSEAGRTMMKDFPAWGNAIKSSFEELSKSEIPDNSSAVLEPMTNGGVHCSVKLDNEESDPGDDEDIYGNVKGAKLGDGKEELKSGNSGGSGVVSQSGGDTTTSSVSHPAGGDKPKEPESNESNNTSPPVDGNKPDVSKKEVGNSEKASSTVAPQPKGAPVPPPPLLVVNRVNPEHAKKAREEQEKLEAKREEEEAKNPFFELNSELDRVEGSLERPAGVNTESASSDIKKIKAEFEGILKTDNGKNAPENCKEAIKCRFLKLDFMLKKSEFYKAAISGSTSKEKIREVIDNLFKSESEAIQKCGADLYRTEKRGPLLFEMRKRRLLGITLGSDEEYSFYIDDFPESFNRCSPVWDYDKSKKDFVLREVPKVEEKRPEAPKQNSPQPKLNSKGIPLPPAGGIPKAPPLPKPKQANPGSKPVANKQPAAKEVVSKSQPSLSLEKQIKAVQLKKIDKDKVESRPKPGPSLIDQIKAVQLKKIGGNGVATLSFQKKNEPENENEEERLKREASDFALSHLDYKHIKQNIDGAHSRIKTNKVEIERVKNSISELSGEGDNDAIEELNDKLKRLEGEIKEDEKRIPALEKKLKEEKLRLEGVYIKDKKASLREVKKMEQKVESKPENRKFVNNLMSSPKEDKIEILRGIGVRLEDFEKKLKLQGKEKEKYLDKIEIALNNKASGAGTDKLVSELLGKRFKDLHQHDNDVEDEDGDDEW